MVKLLGLRLCEHDSNISFFDGDKVHYLKTERMYKQKHHAYNNLHDWQYDIQKKFNIKPSEIDEIAIVVDPWIYNLPTDNEEFYHEVDRRLAEAFPHKFKSSEVPVEENQNRVQEDTSVPAQVVGSSSRSTPNSSKSKIKLTKEDVRLANKWNIPLETYAAQKLKVAEADGEYTQIS